MQRTQFLIRRAVASSSTSTFTRTPIRTFVSSSPRFVGGPGGNPSHDLYEKPDAAPTQDPKKDDSLPNVIESNMGQGSGSKSHATDDSVVPKTVQDAAPEGLEKALPESVHPTKGSSIDPGDKGDSNWKSHATGDSIVPESIQKAAPEALEKALPESIHPTNPKK
ncbi:hypothetical protein LTR10_021679 [Elasticomyces elasticus]|uniref:Mitochondrial tRNAs modification protein n=1 Tax=Exophiala sideris TaxID=1016849 RepID=A0ABR0IVG4_9EURO|nr:hypothetical protein LTR10_021679 [Elasticomyces elasticus]KAK5021124.1 Mitochondrial tRNAs modification protein [Exophiala sideris]KAK5023735.1 hypothetical protein LTR13_011113 [Exophiala sideris]KAK5048814.1 Mitochondrial tRNAs modification protein [Exophiala sideris]KAK5176325.1 Mitochondrial tRNAs modification protein [Eurotiomycetes sp. CCFEE 6388]